jgi:hypothetical protein
MLLTPDKEAKEATPAYNVSPPASSFPRRKSLPRVRRKRKH